MARSTAKTSLIYGCDIISQRLRYYCSPMGSLFQFRGNKPRPLSFIWILNLAASMVGITLIGLLAWKDSSFYKGNLKTLDIVRESAFVTRVFKLLEIFFILAAATVIAVTIYRHGLVVNVIASNNSLVMHKEQRYYAKMALTIYTCKIIFRCSTIGAAIITGQPDITEFSFYISLMEVFIAFVLNITIEAPIIYTCYLGATLGKHVENFSEIYIDTMFDQYMKGLEMDESGDAEQSSDNESSEGIIDLVDDAEKTGLFRCLLGCFTPIIWLVRFLKRTLWHICLHIKTIFLHLLSRDYPELPEMKMTKISSAANMKITDSMRVANRQLIRLRLRKAQVMLSELRDMVSDINKMSSPLIMIYIITEAALTILISTASIQAKIYRSFNPLILPTVLQTFGITLNVVYICVCLDETTKQLKLMVNKVFDFIIMNHRVESEQDTSNQSSSYEENLRNSMDKMRENEEQSETWSQFQYTRKLANTIQFTMGGVLPVTRRLVLSILGHILSAVFISIEIMSIIDTSSTGEHHSRKVVTETARHNYSLSTAERQPALVRAD